MTWRHGTQSSSGLHGARRRRGGVGHYGPAVQGGPGVAAACLAGVHQVRRGWRAADGGELGQGPIGRGQEGSARSRAPRRDLSGGRDQRRSRLRYVCRAAELRRAANQRLACGAADRRHAGACRGARRAVQARPGPAGGLGWVRCLAGRSRRDRGRPRRRCDGRRGCPGAAGPIGVGRLHRVPAAAAGRAGPGRGHCGPARGRRGSDAAARTSGLRPARRVRPGQPRRTSSNCGACARRNGGAHDTVRVRAKPGAGRRGRRLPEPRAARRGANRDRAVRRPSRPGPAGRRRGDHDGDRAQQPARCPRAGRAEEGSAPGTVHEHWPAFRIRFYAPKGRDC
jgi:hypothetical protein